MILNETPCLYFLFISTFIRLPRPLIKINVILGNYSSAVSASFWNTHNRTSPRKRW